MTIGRKCHHSPSQRVWRRRCLRVESRDSPAICVTEPSWSRPTVAQGENCHRGEVGMRIQIDPEDNRIAGVPSALGTRPIRSIADRGRDARRFPAPRPKRQDRERGWSDPTHRTGNPRPSGFRGIETNLSVKQTELPLPQPMRLEASQFRKPFECAIGSMSNRGSLKRLNCQKSQRGVKGARRSDIGIGRPSTGSMLRPEQLARDPRRNSSAPGDSTPCLRSRGRMSW